ncbi:MAG: hypothetical protein K9N06_06640 [Candidatus Cloacimonetes bacterium]|nr:hypothetical protein [Candidatus Cloacimonadota bacterium]
MHKLFFLIFYLFFTVSAFSYTIMAPDNPSSLPLLIAADHIPDLEVKLFSNHTQAHSLFLSGKIPLLLTGYAVGESFARRDVPIKMAASWINGLNWLVSADSTISGFSQLKGEKIYFPFQGSPIEEMSLWLAEKEGLNVETDLETGYLPFASMLEMMRQGNVKFAVMPVSSALQIVDNKNYFFSFDLNDKWQQITDSDFYPQLGLFYNPQQKKDIPLDTLLTELEKAIHQINEDPLMVQEKYGDKLSFAPEVVRQSLNMMRFQFLRGDELQKKMELYFEKNGINPPPRSFYSTD